MRALKLDPFSGISGDMFAGALVDLVDGASELVLLPSRLGLEGVEIGLDWVERASLRARKFEVLIDGTPADRVAGDHGHRHLTEILEILASADLDTDVRSRAADIFEHLGRAEIEAHGGSFESIHFHEAGAVDSIVDIAAAAWLIERAQVERVLCEPICTGFGTIETAHGELPIPGPATDFLLRDYPLRPGAVEGEMTTPTGAAILRHLQPSFERPTYRLLVSAMGAGTREIERRPNVLRASLCEIEAGTEDAEVVVIATNIDDLSGEMLGEHFTGGLLAAGALDVVLHHVTMKRGRPGVQLEVLAPHSHEAQLCRMILEQTSTLGVRVMPVRRRTLPRSATEVTTEYGSIAIKEAQLPDGRRRGVPEFEACREAADQAGVSVLEVYLAAVAACAKGARDRE